MIQLLLIDDRKLDPEMKKFLDTCRKSWYVFINYAEIKRHSENNEKMEKLCKSLRESINKLLADLAEWNANCDEMNDGYKVANEFFDEQFPHARKVYNKLKNVVLDQLLV